MNSDFLLLFFIAVSVIGLTISETHIAFVILALCAGYVLSSFAGSDVLNIMDNWVSQEEFPIFETVNIVLILLPALLIAIRFRRTQRGMSRFVQQLVPALALTMLAVVFIVDVIPFESLIDGNETSYLADTIEDFGPLLIIFAIGVGLFDVLVKHANEPVRRKRGPGRPKR